MRASLHEVAKVLKSSRVPKTITQEPFDYDPGHYKRLCDLKGSQPSHLDLINYALDMTYMELQPDLLRHLMPVLLKAWRRDLVEGDAAGFGGFVEYFWPALLKGKSFQAIFSNAERVVVMRFMRDTILDRLDAEDSLTFSGSRASAYGWVQAFVSFGVLFPAIESLWAEWWQMKTPGHAVAAFQYSSALLYEDDKNPVFTPWIRDEGGGPPTLWECGCLMFDVGWKEENLNFLRRILSIDYIERNLQVASEKIQMGPAKMIVSHILHGLPNQRAVLALRTKELPNLLTNVSSIKGFTL